MNLKFKLLKMISIIYKAIRKGFSLIRNLAYTPYNKLLFYLNGISFGKSLKVRGVINVHVTRRGKVSLGEKVRINSGSHHNVIGRQQTTIFWVEGNLKIGNNSGLSSTAIICLNEIIIGQNVLIGGNCVIYDSDFHSLNPQDRKDRLKDKNNAKKAKVIIEDNVFIGSHTTILKGVTIGKNSVIGACSVVTKNIPKNEVWAGNPISFIKKIDN